MWVSPRIHKGGMCPGYDRNFDTSKIASDTIIPLNGPLISSSIHPAVRFVLWQAAT
jgi:hypothetical protein